MPQLTDTAITYEISIPEGLHESLATYLDTHPTWDLDRVFICAVSLFLMQQVGTDTAAARLYLETLFNP